MKSKTYSSLRSQTGWWACIRNHRNSSSVGDSSIDFKAHLLGPCAEIVGFFEKISWANLWKTNHELCTYHRNYNCANFETILGGGDENDSALALGLYVGPGARRVKPEVLRNFVRPHACPQ